MRRVWIVIAVVTISAMAVAACSGSSHTHASGHRRPLTAATSRHTTAAAASAAPRGHLQNTKPVDVLYGYPLGGVHVDEDSVPGINQLTTLKYLQSLDVDRFLYYFRLNAGLPTGGVQPYGGWESQAWVYGHFVGHYLSACAQMYASLHDDTLLQKATALVKGFAECQEATAAAHPEIKGFFGAMNYSRYSGFRTFTNFNYPCSGPGDYGGVPFYSMHKYMNGLLDWAQQVDDPSGETATLVLEGISLWAAQFINETIAIGTQWLWDSTMQIEFGGMNDVLYAASVQSAVPANVSAEQQAQMFHAGDQFTKACLFGPLAVQHELLDSLHANTHVPQVIGFARRYEMTGSLVHLSAVSYFWDVVTQTRAYATGGMTHNEHWYSTDLSTQLGTNDQETCVSYNMAKLTRMLLRWTGDAKYSSYYHRLFYNGLLGTIDTSDIGKYLYYTPLSAGVTKNFGNAEDSFWCCYGTGIENWAKVGDSIYFTDATGRAAIYVNLFFSSTLDVFADGSVQVEQTTTYPVSPVITFTVHNSNPSHHQFGATLYVLMPWFMPTTGATLSLNGGPAQPITTAPVSYFAISPPEGSWADGTTIQLTLPLPFYAHYMPDNTNMFAVMYGPLVLVGETSTAQLAVDPHVHPPAEWLQVVSATGNSLRFQTVNTTVSVAPAPLRFRPLNEATDVQFTTYFTGTHPHHTATAGAGAGAAADAKAKAERVSHKNRKAGGSSGRAAKVGRKHMHEH